MNKDELVERINLLLKDANINVQPYRKYVTKSGKNVKFLLKVFKNDKQSEIYKLLVQMKKN